MTQVFREDGQILPVTVIETGPCCILQIKNKATDGYNAVQLGFDQIKDSKISKPQREKFKKINVAIRRFVKEIQIENPQDYQVGQAIDVTQFKPGDFIDIIGTSIGKGFQGGIKRWHWSGGPSGHGSMSHRVPGSIGASAFPSRVLKGHHLPGHMGNQRITVQNLEILKVVRDSNLLVVKGSTPGHKNSYLIIKKSKKKKVKAKPDPQPDNKNTSNKSAG